MSFTSLGLSPELLRALADLDYLVPTEIQLAAIPPVLAGNDVLAAAQTGTGKTAAFALPLLQRLSAGNRCSRGPRALVLTPTRELAAQVLESTREYGRHLRMRSAVVFGGVGMQPQVDALRRGIDVLVATPGRLIDHMQRRTVDLSQVEILVLDEADRMLDMGFLPALRRVLSALPAQRQTLLFSATFPDEIKVLARQFMRHPIEVQATPSNSAAPRVQHLVHPVDAARKRDLLLHILAADSRRQTLVFSRTKHGADKLCKTLQAAGIGAAAIHGNKSQNARTRALADFKGGRVTVLVATDIAARGIDIEQLPAVINYDLPMVAEDYVHRIGRTGRAGSDGLALSLVCADESAMLRAIDRMLGTPIPRQEIDGFVPVQPLHTTGPGRQPPRPASSRRAHPGGAAPTHHRGPHARSDGQRRPPRVVGER
jgi:ATP-dependent RNA helicase RhlE